MNAQVVGFPGMTLERAREVVASPDLHRGRDIITACKPLFDQTRGGDGGLLAHETVVAAEHLARAVEIYTEKMGGDHE